METCGWCGDPLTERDVLASAYRGWTGAYCPSCLDELEDRDGRDVAEAKDEYRRIARREGMDADTTVHRVTGRTPEPDAPVRTATGPAGTEPTDKGQGAESADDQQTDAECPPSDIPEGYDSRTYE